MSVELPIQNPLKTGRAMSIRINLIAKNQCIAEQLNIYIITR